MAGRQALAYFREFYSHWPNLLGAAVGLALGSALYNYTQNLFAPALIAEFGWSKAQYALVGSIGIVSMLVVPFMGRLVDRFGARKGAVVGFTVLPLGFLALSQMNGDIWWFYGIHLVKAIFGILTTTFVFTRVIVERFDRARGFALALLLCAPPAAGAISAPFMGEIIAEHGWRTGYQVMAAIAAIGGIIAISLIGRSHTHGADGTPNRKMDWRQLRGLAANPVFRLMIAGMFFCNIPQVLVASQLSLLMMDNGVSLSQATWMLSLYATTVVIGRFASGWALDRVPPHVVAIVALGLPTIGYLGLASSQDPQWLMFGAVTLIGFAQGAETDVSAILASRKFALADYSFIFSLLMTALGLASAIGAAILSLTLELTQSYDVFLVLSAVVTLAGAACFYWTGRYHVVEELSHD